MVLGASMRGFFLRKKIYRWVLILISAAVFTGCAPRPVIKTDNQELVAAYIPPEEEVISNPKRVHFSIKKYKDIEVKNVGTVTAIQFVVRGAEPEKKYILWSQPLGRDITAVYEYETDDYGLLGRQIGNGTMMLDDDLLLMFDFFKGEPVKYYLTSFDKSTVLQAEFVPYPIVAEAKDEAIVTMKRLVPDASLLLCEGNGFLPDEHLLVTTQSGSKIVPSIPMVCKNGKFSFIFEPQVPHKSGGTGYIEIRRFSERVVLDCDWGCEIGIAES
jgi:hypothetical protein